MKDDTRSRDEARRTESPVTGAPQTISLSLVSHTNVGKTTLARTLLNQTIGEVRDEAHVTDQAEAYPLIETSQGDRLVLWDTPGFGDSARLAKRLENADKPFGWLLSQVWDRFADRAIYSSQQAVRNVREEADVVLYLVNAAENPADSGYVEPEMRILQWIGKPIIVLLNQMGPPRGPAEEANEVEQWRVHLQFAPMVRKVMALDAFARCWIQEGTLLREVARCLEGDKRLAFGRLQRAWQTQRRATFDASMDVLARRLTRAALDQERIASDGLRGRLREVGQALGVARERDDGVRQQAMQALANRLDASIRESTNDLIRLHGLEGSAGETVLTRLAEHYATSTHVSEGRAAVFGGLITGALAGLKADVVSGGFTLGGGMIAGGVLGALGAAGLARIDSIMISWTDDVMNRLVPAALLTYLAVAHYGRGRGEWTESEHPPIWETTITEVLQQQSERFQTFWRKRHAQSADELHESIRQELTLAAERVLIRLYPEAIDASTLGTSAARLSPEARAEADMLRRSAGNSDDADDKLKQHPA